MRDFGPVDDRDIAGSDRAGNADLLVALQQRIVEFAVGVRVALEDVVLDGILALPIEFGLQSRDLAFERVLALQRFLVAQLAAARDTGGLPFYSRRVSTR